MNNDYNNDHNSLNNNENADNGFGGAPYFSNNEEKNTPAEEPACEKTERTDAAEASAVSENAEKAEGTGEYHYHGSQIGSFGKEEFSDHVNRTNNYDNGQSQGGSYTHQGFYGQNPQYNRQYNGQPYGAPGGWNQYGSYGNAPQHEAPPQRKKEKKPRKGVSGGVLAIVCALTVVLSALAGFGGAMLYSDNMSRYNAPDNTVGGGTTVIDRVVESDGTTSTGEKGIYTDVATAVKDSVVEITTEFQVTGFFQYVSEGAGSGVIISEDGYVITNNHVISDTSSGGVADSITVRLTNGNEYKAKVIGKDADSDIAVIKITPDEKLTYAVFGDSDKLTVGEEVLAVGNPLGELGGTVTNGIISALDREISVDGTTMNLLQTNAAINPGNSGGGLFNMKGELIGVVNAKSSGSGIEGLGFAIPSNDAYDVATQLMENGYVTGKVYLGVSFSDIDDPYTAYRYFKSQATGVYVVDLVEGYNDGALKVGDRIVAVDGNEITSFSQIKDMLKEQNVGDMLEFAVYRSGKLTQVDVKCYEYVPEQSDSVDFDEE